MTTERLFDIEETDVAATLLALIAASSVSPSAEPAARLLTELLTKSGFEVTVDDWGNVTGRIDFGPGPVLLYDAHLDTVEIGDHARWRHDPAGERVGDRIVGRGAVDTKGPLAAALHAAQRLVADPDGLAGSLVISGSVDEELAEGPALAQILDRVTPDVVVIGEPSDNRLAVGQRGRAEIVVEVTGTSSHTAYPDAGVSAVEVMAEAIVALRELTFRADPHLGAGQLTLTSVRSSPYPSQSTVPSGCVAVFDRRTVVGEQDVEVLDDVRRMVEPIAAAAGASVQVRLARAEWRTWRGVEVDVPVFAAAWFQDPGAWPVDAIRDQLRRAGVDRPTRTWQFCTNGSESAGRRGLPTVGFGPGQPDRAHTTDESIELAELRSGVDGYEAIFRGVLGGGGRSR
ncbi:M20/M25/M40 family metallo-hydrolase [Rhodococcus sp. ABRD24]|uniref:M20/M25/M40 family metallo-hydrolase n=1 Tax=Rhodococcus sp. ABRD24 TaxID=2507582 RepID=UPI00103CFD59|nr:M20/M25/M40 family metallo-hydrolase [Rhodococcus sp. ABRD24]QBJ96052.1 M20/M25/M40 family metallo-hydrolase [Rhodococcus sp. ABRD24]